MFVSNGWGVAGGGRWPSIHPLRKARASCDGHGQGKKRDAYYAVKAQHASTETKMDRAYTRKAQTRQQRFGWCDLGGASGAFVALIALALGPGDYGSTVTTALHELGFDVVEIEDVEVLEERMQRDGLTPAIRKLATMVDEHHPFALGTFHAYED